MREGDLRLVNVDATIVAEEPPLSDYVGTMRERIAASTGVGAGQVSVKATTSDGLGFAGAGAGIAAFAVVLLE